MFRESDPGHMVVSNRVIMPQHTFFHTCYTIFLSLAHQPRASTFLHPVRGLSLRHSLRWLARLL